MGRALEQCLAIPGIQPIRCLSMFFPLWEAEILADVEECEQYQVFDQYLERAISEAGITTVDGLSAFFRIEPPLVRRVLQFLRTIGHVEETGGHYRLTELGSRSQRAAIRYVVKETRQNLLFDGLTLSPLTRAHHAKEIRTLSPPEIFADHKEVKYFRVLTGVLSGPTTFNATALQVLENRPDRDLHNMPRTLRNLRLQRAWQTYLPVHLIETVSQRGGTSLLAFSQLSGGPDELLTRLCDSLPEVRNLFDSEPARDPEDVLASWLDRQGLPVDVLSQLPNGVWRATLPEDVFDPGPLSPTRIGRFQHTKGRFMQLWCDKLAVRRLAGLERGLWLLQTRLDQLEELQRGLDGLARQLEIDQLTVSDLKEHALANDLVAATMRIDALR
ncbi:hypothetical protein [Crossiella sp. NPDC003009]